MFEQEGQDSIVMTTIKQTYVRKRKKNAREREDLGKVIDVPISSNPKEHQTYVDRGASKRSVGSNKDKEIVEDVEF